MPTLTLKVLFVFVVIAHRRREVLQFNVTNHPTAEWIAQQVVVRTSWMPKARSRSQTAAP
jgi:hypothetical protein